MVEHFKVGFLGAGNLAQSMIKGLLSQGKIPAKNIFVSNRTTGKLVKLKDQFGIETCATNEELVEAADIIVLAVKPQDLVQAIEPIQSNFTKEKIVLSLAAGVSFETIGKYITESRLVRAMPNTPSLIGKGVIGYVLEDPDDDGLSSLVEEFLSPLGMVIANEASDDLDSVMIASSCGTGFVFELMSYWQEWLEEHGFESDLSREMIIETFLGAAELAKFQSEHSFEELIAKVASRKGVTEAGLDSMRQTEIERSLRISFEKSAMRNKEILRETSAPKKGR